MYPRLVNFATVSPKKLVDLFESETAKTGSFLEVRQHDVQFQIIPQLDIRLE
jgi:hypothetical protein